MIGTERQGSWKRLAAKAVVDGLLFCALFCLPFAWILRDGLGPDSVTSSGLEALKRFATCLYIVPGTLTLACLSLALRWDGGRG